MSPRDRAGPAAPGWLPPLLIAPLAALQAFAFRWGVITPDTVFQWQQALTGRYDDWHPPATTWLWRQLKALGPGSAPVLLFDIALYWTGVWLVTETLRRRGHPRAMAAAILFAALPIPFGQVGAILKDPLLACCCLVAAGLLLAAGEAGARRRVAAGIAALVLLVFASATRFNAVFATAPLLAAWLPARRTNGLPRSAVALAGAAALLAGGGWAIDNLALRPHHSRPIFSLVNFDLAGIAAHGGADAYPNLDRAAEREMASRCYDPGQFNPTYREDCDGVEEALRAYAEAQGKGATAIWLGAIRQAPLAYLGHRLAHLNRNLRFLVAAVPDDAVYVMTTPNPFGLRFEENEATRVVARAARWMAISPLGRPATWIAVAIGLLLLAPALRARRFVTGTALSAIFYGTAYAVASVAPDMRYNLWTMLAAGMALIVTATEMRSLPNRRLALAALPAGLAVCAELIALAVG